MEHMCIDRRIRGGSESSQMGFAFFERTLLGGKRVKESVLAFGVAAGIPFDFAQGRLSTSPEPASRIPVPLRMTTLAIG